MRYLSTNGRWVSTEDIPEMPGRLTSEEMVDRGLLHPSMLGLNQLDRRPKSENAEEASGLLSDGIPPFGGTIRLTDGPGGEQRFASYYDVMMLNPWAHGTIHTIARGLSRLPLKLYEPADPAGDPEPGTVAGVINPSRKNAAGRVAWALRYPTNGTVPADRNTPPSRRAMWYSTVVNKLIHGNAVWEIIRGNSGLEGFNFIPMEQVEMDEDSLIYKIHKAQYGFPILGMDLRDTGREPERILVPEDVVHFGLWEGGRRPLNPSPVRALHATIALYDAVSRYMVAFFNNGARVSGNLKVEKADPKTQTAIRQEILKLYAGPTNAGKVLVTSGEWQAFNKEPEFDGIVNLMKYSRDEIFVTYGVPPPVMGVIERAIMSNVREMRDQYVRDLIGPHAEFLSGDFEAQVIDRSDSLRQRQIFAEFDVDEQLRPDLWKRAASFRNILLAYTPNELRRIERQQELTGEANPRGYADTIQRPLNESPLSNLPDYGRRDDQNERKVDIEERRVQHEIDHGKGTEPHINDPNKPDEVAPEEEKEPAGPSGNGVGPDEEDEDAVRPQL
jgi:HK97 family phage portal protein